MTENRYPFWVNEELHRRVKATAAMQGMSIREWVELVVEDALDGRPGPSVLVDTREPYHAEEERR